MLSWQILETVRLASEDEGLLILILDLARERDDITRLRAFMALNEIFKRTGGDVKSRVLKNHLDVFIDTLTDENERIVMKALRALGHLVEGIPLEEKEFLEITEVLTNLVENSNRDIVTLEAIDVLSKVRPVRMSESINTKINKLIGSDDPYLKTIGLRLLANSFIPSDDVDALRLLLTEAYTLLFSGEDFLLELILDVLGDVMKYPLPADVKDEVVRISKVVGELIHQKEDPLVRIKAKEVSGRVTSFISSSQSVGEFRRF
ncbi:hypothetical protein A7C91_05725 [Thermococcus piezophilus]|uniref:Condensin complex subunit 1 C-terminal domain-containing protein n=1 Tax=Thermococcus piezophilus TaxID=1712654 RepID=A0A172WHC3_9EURY|nr:hypothetical protein A7C91_05725 [Thermococcus piezophilus]